MQLYTAEGPQLVRDLVASGRRVFLDLKYHDIPNTVAAAVREAAQLGVSMLTVHASGSAKMLRAAVDAARAINPALTCWGLPCSPAWTKTIWRKSAFEERSRTKCCAWPRWRSRMDAMGIVTSAREAAMLRTELGDEFAIVTPGVRSAGTGHGDQVRVVTPAEAIAAGASHIVVGRPITGAADPAAEARAILQQIGA